MVNWQLKTPVCFTIFNRPDTTQKVFEAIRQVKPPLLLIISDGPRSDKLGEVEKCNAVRAIVDQIDWKCELLKNFSDINMGLKHRISSGLDWVFNIVEEAIILEDDCLPHPTFFRFCEDLLEHYRYDERVMLITGTNFQFGLKRTNYSYYFSRYIDCWGWATWKRAWQNFDFEMKQWPEIRDNNWLIDILQDPVEAASWSNIFQNTYDGHINSWAYRWKLACWIQSGLTIIPNRNLVSNIGFNIDAVHTKDSRSPFANTPVEEIDFPLNHPKFVIRDAESDDFTKRVMFSGDTVELRKRLADSWLNLTEEDFASEYNQVNIKNLLNSSIKDEVLNEAETVIQKELIKNMNTESDDNKKIQYLLASMLYCYPHQLPLQYDLSQIPEWLLHDYLKFTLEPPYLFQEVGEVNQYSQYLEKWINYLHTIISNDPNSKLCQEVAIALTKYGKFIPPCIMTENIKNICQKRSEILEFALKSQGYEIDYNFQERLPGRNKIRLGILAENFGLKTQIFAKLPIFKYLNRDVFEIIIYSLWSSGDRIERYCSGHVDVGIQLPEDLDSQVQTIRDDDLDILFIADNITAKTTPITLMSLHRLARVQVTGISSGITSGIRNIDYYISGELNYLEKQAARNYTETLVTLSGSGMCWDFATEEQGISTTSISRKSIGIDENDIVYVSGSGCDILLPEVEVSWAKIIANVPNSKLLLYPHNISWSSSYTFHGFKNRLKATCAKFNISEKRVIILEPVQNRVSLKECFKLGDIYLDSYPSSDHTSVIAALEIGLPTVVMAGNFACAWTSSSLLQEIAMYDLIADTEELYIQLGVNLGKDQEFRQEKSKQIQDKMQILPGFLDSRSYSTQMGTLLQKLFLESFSDSLRENFNLRDINLLIFPDWNQAEDLLCNNLADVIRAIATRPDSDKITLLIDTSDISVEDAQMLLSGITMNFLMEEDLDVTEDLVISLIEPLADIHWQALMPYLYARIVLEHENQQAVANVKADTLPCYEVEKLAGEFFFT
ncbi:glycosyltransferase [Aetokthonos hydrillicola Thurmond2011]|jgi:predicted O-linked N-acetylglucosamine transferase (SPINDLY family)|uniref:Glycosyltransferase n=1 Tax=Aetokthonos hydrillicola Thurmond2011 TaxID=2712845 RepID=A0AAP5I7X1_9CYAN|nr:glycosyltransferase [Aetokthonos hydrillicola]MBW4590064.1 glycosyltransferase [Aetokthonos hydrillicola CCALA 1050]MDR9894883.1 glycosyltransferase [Aetokthonos hydrillicola Thurmond2011]